MTKSNDERLQSQPMDDAAETTHSVEGADGQQEQQQQQQAADEGNVEQGQWSQQAEAGSRQPSPIRSPPRFTEDELERARQELREQYEREQEERSAVEGSSDSTEVADE